MIYFRFHRATLDESLKTIITAPTAQQLVDYIKQSDEARFLGVADLQCRYYAEDLRDERFTHTYIITATIINHPTHQPVVIGFSSADISL